MSLFENDEYRYRETYFVLFESAHRPTAADMQRAIDSLGGAYEVADVRVDEEGRFESLTLYSPDDYAAMDIALITGEDVVQQRTELIQELKPLLGTKEERAKLDRLRSCDARLDIFHFEQVLLDTPDEEEEPDVLDPGSLLLVLARLSEVCRGVAVDPQSATII